MGGLQTPDLLPVCSESGDELEEVKACLSPSSSLPGFGGGCLKVEDEQEWKGPSWLGKVWKRLDGVRCRLAVLCVVLWEASGFSTSCKHSCV